MKENGIKATIIGMITEDCSKIIHYKKQSVEILQPDTDELYKVIK